MLKGLALWKRNGNAKRLQEVKGRILKQREPILDAFAESVKGAKSCPRYMGGPCTGILCEDFQEYGTVPGKDGKSRKYRRCNYTQTPRLLVELLDETRATNWYLKQLLKVFTTTKEKTKEPT